MDLFLLCRQSATEDTEELKMFTKYVNALVCTVKGNPLDYLDYVNSLHKISLHYLEYANYLHKNLQFNLETPNGSGVIGFSMQPVAGKPLM